MQHSLSDLYRDVVEWRRFLHQNPGLAYEETFASALIGDKLASWNIPFRRIAGTGVVGWIEGRASGKTIGLRADMDALAISEQTNLPWASKIAGKMHACGHDGHTAILLGTAKYLQEHRDFDGRVLLIFQPAEENGNFGAGAMIRDGLFAGDLACDEVYALHNSPAFRLGTALTCAGPMMASSDNFHLTVVGKGGSVAFPSETINPNWAAAEILANAMALGEVLYSRSDFQRKALIAAAAIHGGGDAFNIVPAQAEIRLTMRAYSDEMRKHVKGELAWMWDKIAKNRGVQIQVDEKRGYDPTVNSPAQTKKAVGSLEGIFGQASVNKTATPIMAAEDFGAMLQKVPGCYVTLGQATDDPASQNNQNLHSGKYDFNDDLIPLGIKYFCSLVKDLKPV